MATMRLEKQENVYLLTLNHGERANTMTDAVLDEYHAALDEVEASQGNTALVITSEDPKFFSNGIDLEYIKSKGMEYLFSHFGARLDQLLMRVALINFPTIACVTGHAYGGGALLASACDFRTMRADRGFFCFPEVDIKLAFTPAMLASVNLLRNEQLRFEMAIDRPPGGWRRSRQARHRRRRFQRGRPAAENPGDGGAAGYQGPPHLCTDQTRYAPAFVAISGRKPPLSSSSRVNSFSEMKKGDPQVAFFIAVRRDCRCAAAGRIAPACAENAAPFRAQMHLSD
jgi:hypothetical protein